MAGRNLRQGRYERVWRIVMRIPQGKVATYGQIADMAGMVNGARQVGYALHAIPPGFPVPWHRVLNARGTISFPPDDHRHRTQRRSLESEGVLFQNGRIDFRRFRWRGIRRR